jgi:xanthine dehydrogenase accessory factor
VSNERPLVIIRGGGDIATGVAVRLWRCGFAVVITEIAQPLAVRRLVALAQAVYEGTYEVEGVRGRLARSPKAAEEILQGGEIPVLIDPQAGCRLHFQPVAIVDARMRKKPPEIDMTASMLSIGLGPGFTAGVDCQAVVETNRGHHMGRVLWEGSAERDTGVPEAVGEQSTARVLRAPHDGVFTGAIGLGSTVRKGEVVARAGGEPILAPFDGALRGLLHDGLHVQAGQKVGDLDPRGDPSYCREISDKSLAIGGGVLEILLARPAIRAALGA